MEAPQAAAVAAVRQLCALPWRTTWLACQSPSIWLRYNLLLLSRHDQLLLHTDSLMLFSNSGQEGFWLIRYSSCLELAALHVSLGRACGHTCATDGTLRICEQSEVVSY